MTTRHTWTTLLLVAMIGCGSSGPETAPLSGDVTLDGQPIASAAILFTHVDGGRLGQAVSDDQGRFDAWTFVSGDGVLVGEHHVTVTFPSVIGRQATTDGLEGAYQLPPALVKSLVPTHYSRVETSGLTVKVIAGEQNRIELALTSRPPN